MRSSSIRRRVGFIRTAVLASLAAMSLVGAAYAGASAVGAPGKGNGQNTVTIASSAAVLTFGHTSNISGQVTGAGNAGVTVRLEENPFPYTGGFKPTALSTTTSATGTYSFVVKPTLSTHYRVTAKTKPGVTSPEAAVGVRVKVTFHLGDSTPKRGQRVRFYGTVLPAHDGKLVTIQRRAGTGVWKTISSVALVAGAPVNGVARSTYSKRLKISRSGTYRVHFDPADGDHLANNSATRHAATH
jgi:hypothetical protein